MQISKGVLIGSLAVIAVVALASGIGVSSLYARTQTITIASTSTETRTLTSIAFPNGTITKSIIIVTVENATAYACGTNTYIGGTAQAFQSTTTEFEFSTAANLTRTGMTILNVTIITTTSTDETGWVTNTVTTITQKSSSEGTTVLCPTVT